MNINNHNLLPSVSIIILNWNGWEDTIECLESLYGVNYKNYQVIVVDNDSHDDSIDKIRAYCQGKLEIKSDFFEFNSKNKPINVIEFFGHDLKSMNSEVRDKLKKFNKINDESKNLILIKNSENYGFADGNNIGIKFALDNFNSDYFLLLNNDTTVHKDFITPLVEFSQSDSKIGLAGPKIYSYDRPREIQTTGFNIQWFRGEIVSIGHTEKDEGQYDQIKSVDCISGCAMLVKKDVVLKMGNFLDHEYFLYYEDMDSCLRTKKLGYEIYCVPNSKIWHKTSSASKNAAYTAGFYIARNVFIFMKKYADLKHYYLFILYYFVYKLWYSIALNTVYYRDVKAFIPIFKGTKQGLIWKP